MYNLPAIYFKQRIQSWVMDRVTCVFIDHELFGIDHELWGILIMSWRVMTCCHW